MLLEAGALLQCDLALPERVTAPALLHAWQSLEGSLEARGGRWVQKPGSAWAASSVRGVSLLQTHVWLVSCAWPARLAVYMPRSARRGTWRPESASQAMPKDCQTITQQPTRSVLQALHAVERHLPVREQLGMTRPKATLETAPSGSRMGLFQALLTGLSWFCCSSH